MTTTELEKILADVQAAPRECEWIEVKFNNDDPQELGEYISALANGAAHVGQPRAYLVHGLDDATHEVIGTKFNPKLQKYGNEELESWLSRLLSPRIDFSFHELNTPNGRVVLTIIDSAGNTPVKFKNTSYIRVGSYKKPLVGYPERERKIWQNTHYSTFESKIAMSGASGDEILDLINYPAAFRLLNIPLPDNKEALLNKMAQERLIIRRPSCYDITNLGAILFAFDLNHFLTLSRKAVRIILYKGQNRVSALKEKQITSGYAIAFEGLMQFLVDNLPSNEQIGKVFRKEIPVYPELALREFVANALIHQDFSIGGTSPMIEIFSNRVEITNPGVPLIDTMRFIDHAPLSRNEALAALMRRMNLCEERGSGVDRALTQCELYQLPAPEFRKDELFTKVTMFAPMTLRQMDKEGKVRACYQHCCLVYVAGSRMTNESFRGRLGVEDKNYSIASRIISDAIDAKLIKPYSESQSKRYAQYIPIWA